MDYKITSVQRKENWQNEHGAFQDYAIQLEGQGWVKLTQKESSPAPISGDTIHGDLVDMTTKNGTTYKKLKKSNPNYDSHTTSSAPKYSKDEDAIKAMWAIGQAVSVYGDDQKTEGFAAQLYNMVDRIKSGRSAVQDTFSTEDDVVVDVPDGEIDLSEIPF